MMLNPSTLQPAFSQQQQQQQQRAPAVGKPIIRTMTPLTAQAVNQIKALRARYALAHPQSHVGIPLVGSPLVRTVARNNPYLQNAHNPYAMSNIVRNVQHGQLVPNSLGSNPLPAWSLGTLQSRYPHNFGYPLVAPPQLRKRVTANVAGGRQPPNMPLLKKKMTLPSPAMVPKRGPPALGIRKAVLPRRPPPSAAAVIAAKRRAAALIAARREAVLRKPVRAPVPKDPSLVGIWDKIYRFYTHNGKDDKITVPDERDVARLDEKSVVLDSPKGIAVIEKFLQSKLSDKKSGGGVNTAASATDGVDFVGVKSTSNTDAAAEDETATKGGEVKTGVPVLRIETNNSPKTEEEHEAHTLKEAPALNDAADVSSSTKNPEATLFDDNTQSQKNNIAAAASNATSASSSAPTTMESMQEDSILKSISSTPHSWDKRGKVTFAIEKKTNIPGRPRVTGVWGSLKRKRRKNNKKKKKRKKRRSLVMTSSIASCRHGYTDVNCLRTHVEYG